jgi:hypothetical protein
MWLPDQAVTVNLMHWLLGMLAFARRSIHHVQHQANVDWFLSMWFVSMWFASICDCYCLLS